MFMRTAEAVHESKTKLLDAALHVIRAKGYTATRVEDICETAGLTKGSFFHHFENKEELALEAAEHWQEVIELCGTRSTAYWDMWTSARRSCGASCPNSPAWRAR